MAKPDPCDARSPHGWTLDTLEEHLSGKITAVATNLTEKIQALGERTNERFLLAKQAVDAAVSGVEKASATALSSADRAVTKAEVGAEKRFDSMNEFRAAMKDQQNTFADRAQTDFRLIAVERKQEVLAGQAQGVGLSVGVIVQIISSCASIALIISVVALLFKR